MMKHPLALVLCACALLLGALAPALAQAPLIESLTAPLGKAPDEVDDGRENPAAGPATPAESNAAAEPTRPRSSGLLPVVREARADPAPAAPASPRAGPHGIPVGSPYGRFVSAIAQEPGMDARRHLLLAQQYFHDVGFDVPSADPQVQGTFDENSTVVFTHVMGDVDGDGTDDVVLDVYCVLYDCRPFPSILRPQEYALYYADNECGQPHRLFAISGANGTAIWNTTMNRPTNPAAMVGCSIQFVVGTVPLDNGTYGLLTYKYDVTVPTLIEYVKVVSHQFSLLDPKTGRSVWNQTYLGYLTGDTVFGTEIVADTLVVNPLLMVPPRKGVSILPPGLAPRLFLQGVGFNYTGANTLIPPTGFDSPLRVVDSYQPNEWAARLEPRTGRQEWRRLTFQPDTRRPQDLPVDLPIPYRSVVPGILRVPSLTPPTMYEGEVFAPFYEGETYWRHVPCCFDSTGDGVSDLLYTTVEWGALPHADVFGPYYTSAHAVLFDGATGERVWDVATENSTIECLPCYVQWTESLGDVNGDNASEFLLHQVYYNWDFFHNVSVRDGATGGIVWEYKSRKDLQTLVVGDATGDGANDVVVTDWASTDQGFDPSPYGFVNVTITPLSLFSGAEGRKVWTVTSFIAPIDLFYVFELMRLNGLPDADGDGVGDLYVDDPVYLSDLTVVHRQSVVSGVDGGPLYEFVNLGAFSFPCLAGDVDGDGIEDLAVLNGDINDLWITSYNATNGDPIWSRRLLALRQSSYTMAIPQLRCQSIGHADDAREDILVNFQLDVLTLGGYFPTRPLYPQIAAYDGLNGSAFWATPRLWDGNVSVLRDGASPLSELYVDAVQPHPAGFVAAVDRDRLPLWGGLGVFAIAFGASFAATAFGRRWWKS